MHVYSYAPKTLESTSVTSHFFKDVDARERAVSSALRTAACNASEGGYGTGHAPRRRLSSRKRRTDFGSVKMHRGQVMRKMKASSMPLLARISDTVRDAGMFGSPKRPDLFAYLNEPRPSPVRCCPPLQ